MPSPKQRWGSACEALAETYLAQKGYVIVERNWRGAGGEIDRIAWLDRILVFVEVRARSTMVFGTPAETIGVRKQQRILRAAAAYLSRFPPAMTPMARFDVVSIVELGAGRIDVALIEDAFGARR